MGQQQLLLVILVTIIVGIATIIAIATLKEQSFDHVFHQDMHIGLNIALEVYEKSKRPVALGGGGGSFDSQWMNFNNITCPFVPEDNNSACATNDRTHNAIFITLYPEGSTAKVRFAEHQAINGLDDWGHPPGSKRLAMEWTITSDGVQPAGPLEVTNF